MSMIDFIILGLVIEKPMSCYEINKEIEIKNMSKWVKISSPAIYKNTPKLETRGFLSGKCVKEGQMPEKIIYSITESGHAQFEKLINKFTENLGNFNFQFTPILVNIGKLSKKRAIEIIDKIKNNIKKEIMIYKAGVDNLPANMTPTSLKIVEFYGDFYSYLDNWIDEFKSAYIEEQNKEKR